jgi:hypothetical protein
LILKLVKKKKKKKLKKTKKILGTWSSNWHWVQMGTNVHSYLVPWVVVKQDSFFCIFAFLYFKELKETGTPKDQSILII